ncbi:hypothetical protein [Moraxella lacunata]|uniref:hypothetical protein n=1 Tax=Moraxella lacunata TaxID=477 RepID=UPI003EDE8094
MLLHSSCKDDHYSPKWAKLRPKFATCQINLVTWFWYHRLTREQFMSQIHGRHIDRIRYWHDRCLI